MSILLFYVASFFISLVLCIPIGPVNIEIFQQAIKKHYKIALSIAFGAAVGDAIWATCAFYGITPFLKEPNGASNTLEAIFLLITAIITFILGMFAMKDAKFILKKEEQLVSRIKRKRWAILKGLTMVLVNPLGIASWMISLSFLRKMKIYIPNSSLYVAIFFLTVIIGASFYFSLIVFITNKMRKIFIPERSGRVIKILGYVLIIFSIYFLFYAAKAFFFPNQANSLLK